MADQPLTYHDFKIEMSNLKPDNIFMVRVMDATPTGQTMRADQAEIVKFNADDFTDVVSRLDRRRAGKDELFQLGAKLCGLLLPGRVRTLFDGSLNWAEQNNAGVRVRLSVEPLPLSALPWEFTHVAETVGEPTANDFLVLQRRVSLVRSENIGRAVKPPEGKDKLRVVIALASPKYDKDDPNHLEELDLSNDKTTIRNAMKAVNGEKWALDPVWVNPPTREKLLEKIKGADIFHFSGHGAFTVPNDGSLNRQGQIILEKDDEKPDPYPSDQLANLLATAGTRLVVLGTCESATRDVGGAWSGVAPALVREKVPCVVGMQFKIADSEASRFMPLLYGGMVAGLSIDEAVYWGRQAIFTMVSDWAVIRDWGVPVLYLLAPDGNLFPLPATAGHAADSRREEVRQQFTNVSAKVRKAEGSLPSRRSHRRQN